jgi:meiotically up-regulated gene 157 (Mug157) protein
MAIVELRGLASLLKQVGLRPDIQAAATKRASSVEAALWKWGTVLTKDWGEVFAYEVDGACNFGLMNMQSVATDLPHSPLPRIWRRRDPGR